MSIFLPKFLRSMHGFLRGVPLLRPHPAAVWMWIAPSQSDARYPYGPIFSLKVNAPGICQSNLGRHTRSYEKCQFGTFQCILEIQCQSVKMALCRVSGKLPSWQPTNFPQHTGTYFESSQIGNFQKMQPKSIMMLQKIKVPNWHFSPEWVWMA